MIKKLSLFTLSAALIAGPVMATQSDDRSMGDANADDVLMRAETQLPATQQFTNMDANVESQGKKTGLNLDNAPTDASDEKSTTLSTIMIKDIMLEAGGNPSLSARCACADSMFSSGGVIPVHSHENRPAILYVLHGSMTIYSNKDDTPRVVNEGESITEFNDIKHYATNNSDKDFLQILTFDLLDDGK